MIITEILPYGKMKSRVLTDGDLVFSVYKGELKKYGLEEGAELSERMTEDVLLPLLTYPEQCISDALKWAQEKHYVDDRRFAENYIRWNGEGKSRKRLMYDLTQKGISRELAEELLEEMPPDEAAQIRKELEKQKYHPEKADLKERQRIAAKLSRRGYSWTQIENAMRHAEEV